MGQKIRKVVFPVGGFGTRFLPATKAIPKEMLPVNNIPLIQYAFEEAKAAGMEQFIFITGRNKSAINNHFDVSYELNSFLSDQDKKLELQLTQSWIPDPGKIVFIRQQIPAGLGHALLCARDVVGNEPFAVILADELFVSPTSFLKQMVEVYSDNPGNIIGIDEEEQSALKNYGVAAIENYKDNLLKLTGLVEKPDATEAPSNFIVAGRYILQPQIFDFLSKAKPGKNNEIQLTDAMNAMLREKQEPFFGLKFDGHRFDCGTHNGWLDANIFCALMNKSRRAEVESLLHKYFKTCLELQS